MICCYYNMYDSFFYKRENFAVKKGLKIMDDILGESSRRFNIKKFILKNRI